MKRWAIGVLAVFSPALVSSAGFGQFLGTPSPANTLTVGVTGSAESAADWAEINLAAKGSGVSAQEALAGCEEAWHKLRDELLAVQIPEEDIRPTPPEITADASGAAMMAAMGEGDEAPSYAVSRSVIVRLPTGDLETLYEDVCEIIDIAVDAGAVAKTGQPWEQVWQSQDLVTFGVNDPKPLRAQAIANGLAAAQEVGEVVAASARRKLGAVSGVQVQEYGTGGYMDVIGMMGFPAKAGQGVYRASLTVTFQLQ